MGAEESAGESTGITVPDGIRPLIGVRGWRGYTNPHTGAVRLVSCFKYVTWLPGRPLHARCVDPFTRVEQHIAPQKACSCGVYARKAVPWDDPWNTTAIVGLVALWGRVIVGDLGWRAEYAKPLALLAEDHPERQVFIESASEVYGLRIVDSLYEALRTADSIF